MNLHQLIVDFLGWLLGLQQAQTIEDFDWGFAAPWARNAPLWVLFACAGLFVLTLTFYLRFQPGRRPAVRTILALFRAAVLCLLVLFLAEPVLTARVASQKRPILWLLFDGTDSMAIQDELSATEKAALDEALEPRGDDAARPASSAAPPHSRMDYLKALVAQDKDKDNLLRRLGEKFRLRAFLFEGPHGARGLELAKDDKSPPDGKRLAAQLTANGKVTAIGAALEDLGRRQGTTNLGGAVIFSDFNENAGPWAVTAAKQLGVAVHTVGIGATSTADLGVEIQPPIKVKKGELASVAVTLRQQGLDGQKARVRVFAEPLGSLQSAPGSREPIGPVQEVTLAAPESRVTDPEPRASSPAKSGPGEPPAAAFSNQTIQFRYEPKTAGRFLLVAEADRLPGEAVEENNRAACEITVLDDYLRLLFVEYEPTWQWRFIKEVFHRDRLVGMEGFRTYLHASDPRVRGPNELFLPAMTASRSKFFTHDVIFLGDLPGSVLSPRFCEMVKEFVGEFGGGLVLLAGPRFGPAQYADTPLADLLPVTVDPGKGRDDCEPFTLQLTAEAPQCDFMGLGETLDETRQAWENLGKLTWYQPVRRVHPQAKVLAEHPTLTCVDGKQKQPLIAVRPYGRGEVIYLGIDETWRLRRLYGEKYYRKFWGLMIQRLALRHALGKQKRFIPRTDSPHYQAGETVTVSVAAYNADFNALDENNPADQKLLNDKCLEGKLIVPGEGKTIKSPLPPAARGRTGEGQGEGNAEGTSQPAGKTALTPGPSPGGRGEGVPLRLTQTKKGLFETRWTVFAPGEYRVSVTDPVTRQPETCAFQVVGTPVERQQAVRDVALQKALAAETGGRSFDLTDVRQLPDRIRPAARTEVSVEVVSLAEPRIAWTAFGLVLGLLMIEWLVRKGVNLP